MYFIELWLIFYKFRSYERLELQVHKNYLLLTNVHDFYVLEDKTSKKKIPSVCLSVRPSGCTYVRGLFMWTQ